jgi:hypothetical protein
MPKTALPKSHAQHPNEIFHAPDVVPAAVAAAEFEAVVELPEPEVWPWALLVFPGAAVFWPFADVEVDTVTLNVSLWIDCMSASSELGAFLG